MIRLPNRRKREPQGIRHEPQRVWPRHRRFIRGHVCVVTMGRVHDDCDGPIECCHYRTAANSGKSLKPADWHCFPGCRKYHAEQHQIGQPAFERKYGLSLADICAEFARLSTDRAMKETMREYGYV